MSQLREDEAFPAKLGDRPIAFEGAGEEPIASMHSLLDRKALVRKVMVACSPCRQADRVCRYFIGLSSFHGSFTLGMVSNSMLASLPSFISVRRM